MDIVEKLELWEKLAGLKPTESNNMRIPENWKLTNEKINACNEDLFKINKNFDMDDVYTTIYLKHYFELLIKQQIITTADYLNHKEVFHEYFQQCDILNNALLENEEEKIRSETIKLFKEFNINAQTEVQNADIFTLAEIYVHSLINMRKTLTRVHLRGGSKNTEKPRLISDIYCCGSIDQAIARIECEPFNSISLNLICHPDLSIEYSYFSFIVKDGENVFILYHELKLEDTEDKVKYLYRSSGGETLGIGGEQHFPYYLIDLNADDLKSKSNKSCLVMAKINDLRFVEALWVINMMRLIQREYFEFNE